MELNVTIDERDQKKWFDQGMESLRYEYDILPSDLVIDLGAYQGEFAERINNKFHCLVICVEPLDFIDRLDNMPWCTIIKKMASDHEGFIDTGGAFYYTSEFNINPTHQIPMPCFNICDIITGPVKLLKVNIEGSEYDVLTELINSNHIRRIENIQVQFHKIKGSEYQEQYDYIFNRLYETHELTWGYPFVWQNWKRKDNVEIC